MVKVRIMFLAAIIPMALLGVACEQFQIGAARGGLHKAAKEGDMEKVKSLLAENPDKIDDKDPIYGYTPLHRAAHQGHYEVAEYLLDQGADVNAESKKGETPLKLARQQENMEVADLLESWGGEE